LHHHHQIYHGHPQPPPPKDVEHWAHGASQDRVPQLTLPVTLLLNSQDVVPMREVCLGANVKADEDAVHPHRVSTLSDAGNRANARDRRPATRGTPPSTLSATSLLMTRPPRPRCIVVCRQRAWMRAGGNVNWGQQIYMPAARHTCMPMSGTLVTGRARTTEDLHRGARLAPCDVLIMFTARTP